MREGESEGGKEREREETKALPQEGEGGREGGRGKERECERMRFKDSDE